MPFKSSVITPLLVLAAALLLSGCDGDVMELNIEFPLGEGIDRNGRVYVDGVTAGRVDQIDRYSQANRGIMLVRVAIDDPKIAANKLKPGIVVHAKGTDIGIDTSKADFNSPSLASGDTVKGLSELDYQIYQYGTWQNVVTGIVGIALLIILIRSFRVIFKPLLVLAMLAASLYVAYQFHGTFAPLTDTLSEKVFHNESSVQAPAQKTVNGGEEPVVLKRPHPQFLSFCAIWLVSFIVLVATVGWAFRMTRRPPKK